MRVALLIAVASLCALAVGPAASASGSDLAVTYQVDVAHSGFSGATWGKTICPDGTNSSNDGGTCVGHL